VPPLPERPREPKLRYVLLFLATLVSTTFTGAMYFGSVPEGFDGRLLPVLPDLIAQGMWYSVPVLSILGAHELGHYFACRYYGVNSSLPYFLPMPLFMTGTLGAVIRIRQPIPGKRALFDIGIAGPIAGFLVLIPVLIAGIQLSEVVPIPAEASRVEFGEPLLFKMLAWLKFGHLSEGYTINGHPMVFAAWFGMLATTLNLIPIGQLDGGHISYAALGQRSLFVTVSALVGLVLLTFFATSWVVWLVLTALMLYFLGLRHPRVWDEDVPLDATRRWLAGFAIVMFSLCFTPVPIQFTEPTTDPRPPSRDGVLPASLPIPSSERSASRRAASLSGKTEPDVLRGAAQAALALDRGW
jgi:membrane-associated protease RseP (regulator of RpoE activity)